MNGTWVVIGGNNLDCLDIIKLAEEHVKTLETIQKKDSMDVGKGFASQIVKYDQTARIQSKMIQTHLEIRAMNYQYRPLNVGLLIRRMRKIRR